MLGGRRPCLLRNDRVREHALRVRSAAGRVVWLVCGNAVPELLRQQARDIWTAHRSSKRIGDALKITGPLREGWNRDQAGGDALIRARALIIAKVEYFVLLNGSAHGSAELILPVEAPLR